MNFNELTSVALEPAKTALREVPIKKPVGIGDPSHGPVVDSVNAQAAKLQSTKIKLAEDNSDLTQASVVAASVLNKRITQALTVKSGNVDLASADNAETAAKKAKTDQVDVSADRSLFDFKAVAVNVLKFIGGALQKAANNGASSDDISQKIEQAKAGVASGIKLAKEDLGELLNPALNDGIKNAESEIGRGIDDFEKRYLSETQAGLVTSLSQKSQNNSSSDISIRTAQGDSVFIRLSSSQSSSASGLSLKKEEGDMLGLSIQSSRSLNYSVEVEGDINKDELKAISDLVSKMDDVASQFFYGDIQTSYNSALGLGYDNKQLSGFAMQLKQSESYQKMQQYGDVKYATDAAAKEVNVNAPKSVAQYMNKMLDVIEQSKQLLENNEQYNTLINGLVNEMKDVQVPDLVTAINKFHTFASKLMDERYIGSA